MKRSTFLRGGGVALVLVAGGGVWRAQSQGVFQTGQGAAYMPWKTWREETGSGPLSLVRAAILAASPHNTQPWLFEVSDQSIKLFADTRRSLGSFDPYLREMTIGLGCALENTVVAAAANGYRTEVLLSPGNLTAAPPSGEPILVATVELSTGQVHQSELYDAIPHRHTNRSAYDPERPLTTRSIDQLRAMADGSPDARLFLLTSPPDKAKYIEATIRSTEQIIADAEMVHDSQKWFRTSWADVQTHRDGPTVDSYGLSPLFSAAVKMLPTPSAQTSHQQWLDITRTVHLQNFQVFGLIAVRDLHDRKQALIAGRLWQKLHLWATTQDIDMHPINQCPEMVDRELMLSKPAATEQMLARITADPSWKITFCFRVGHAVRGALPSPRRAVENVIA